MRVQRWILATGLLVGACDANRGAARRAGPPPTSPAITPPTGAAGRDPLLGSIAVSAVVETTFGAPTDSQLIAAAVADITGDGLDDVLAIDTAHHVHLWTSPQVARLPPPDSELWIRDAGVQLDSLALVPDVDGDGDEEVVATGFYQANDYMCMVQLPVPEPTVVHLLRGGPDGLGTDTVIRHDAAAPSAEVEWPEAQYSAAGLGDASGSSGYRCSDHGTSWAEQRQCPLSLLRPWQVMGRATPVPAIVA